VNSHKIVRARQSTFTPNCLQRLREFSAQWPQEASGSSAAVGADPEAFQVAPSEILLPDFVCEVRLGPPVEPLRVLLVLADSLALLTHTNAQVAAEITRWTDQVMSKAQWQALSSEMTSHLTVFLHHARLEIINCYSIMISSQCLRMEFTPTSFNSQSLFELLCAAKQLDLTSLFVSLPLEAKPNFLGLQSQSRHVSQASLLSQVPLSSSPCSTKFFKKKFDSLWGYFNFSA
uniref:Chromosome 17 open reading frame 106 n=1 Tax=Macrostomum lignano TaxID=282301 RepID=A0A1I8J315_9PLAT